MIAMEGLGGSGKSALARELALVLGNSYVVSIDDFIVKEKLAEPSWDEGGFDRIRLAEQVLKPLNHGVEASYQKLIWQEDRLSEPTRIPDVDYLIVEGISAYHPDIARYYDFKIWVDTPAEIASKRGHARDGSNENAKYWELWKKNDLDYVKKYQPDQQADFTIDNSADRVD